MTNYAFFNIINIQLFIRALKLLRRAPHGREKYDKKIQICDQYDTCCVCRCGSHFRLCALTVGFKKYGRKLFPPFYFTKKGIPPRRDAFFNFKIILRLLSCGGTFVRTSCSRCTLCSLSRAVRPPWLLHRWGSSLRICRSLCSLLCTVT